MLILLELGQFKTASTLLSDDWTDDVAKESNQRKDTEVQESLEQGPQSSPKRVSVAAGFHSYQAVATSDFTCLISLS